MTKKNYTPSKAHQDVMKKPEQNPIEEAIGERAGKKSPKEIMRDAEKVLQTPTEVVKQILPKSSDEPTPSEMLTLEELNHETVERLQDQYPEEENLTQEEKQLQIPEIPVSKPESQPVTKTCSPESPPQKIEKNPDDDFVKEISELPQEKFEKQIANDGDTPQTQWVCPDYSEVITGPSYPKLHKCKEESPAEDKELTALKKYIMGSGFVVTGVAYHIVALCSQPMTTPCTTTWDFKDRAMVPEMVFTLLRQPGYLEGIWPSLKVVMSSNIGNDSWCAGICTTIAFFDVIRTLPAVKELANEENEKKS